MDKIKIGSFIKVLRMEKNLTQEKFVEQFSDFIGIEEVVSVAMVSKWERGDSLPSIENIKDLARFYQISIDEIFNGEKKLDIDFSKKYFIANTDWAMKYDVKDKSINLWDIRNEQELLIEKTFNVLLCKMVDNAITSNEEKEFDFIVDNFYNLYCKETVEETKFAIREQCALMHKSTLDEKLWEAYKFFGYKKKIDFFYDLCDNVFDGGAEMIGKRIKAMRDVEKDILLAYVQKNNITHRYGKRTFPDLFKKTYGIDYDEEALTKQVIKLLIENGAYLNETLLGYYEKKKVKRNIIDTLEKGYVQYKKPINIAVIENGKYKYYQIENTKKNREHINLKDEPRFGYEIKEEELENLEQKLFDGEKEYIDEYISWVGIDDALNKENDYVDSYYEEANKEYIKNTVKDLSYSAYQKGKSIERTQMLLYDLDILSLEEIREKYFAMEMKADECIY